MAKIRFVTFDCASTLVDVRWDPARLAVESARAVGCRFDAGAASNAYHRMLSERWGTFRELNLQRSQQVCDAFWMELTADWAKDQGLPDTSVERIYREAENRLFGPQSEIFHVYSDVGETLETLSARGMRLAVVSNWDVSLHRVLAMFDLTKHFEFVIASLEHGVEKPNPGIFELALMQFGARPEEVVHVGDDPMDDLHGARQAGMQAFLVDRSQPTSGALVLKQLTDILDRF